MLVLTRKIGETCVIGDGVIRVTVVAVKEGGRQVRLGFEAPDGIKVLREEVYRRNKVREDQK